MKKINFSVLMSVYKGDNAEYVKIAIDSLLNQTLLPNQIVIIADGPISKEIKTLLKKYQENEIFSIYFRDNNIGLGLTLNEGLSYCKYDYVARMDADDYSCADRFEKQIRYLEEHPNVSAIGCNITEYDMDLKEIISIKKVPETDSEIKEFVKHRNPMNHPTVVFKKFDVLEAGSYENYMLFEDYYLWAKLISRNCELYNIQECLYNFRAGNSMYERRGGIRYLKYIKNFERGLLKLGLINKFEYIKNLIKRYVVALMPSKIRGAFYKILLRKNK